MLSLGNVARSTTNTLYPLRASNIAVGDPPQRAPTTIASYITTPYVSGSIVLRTLAYWSLHSGPRPPITPIVFTSVLLLPLMPIPYSTPRHDRCLLPKALQAHILAVPGLS